MRDLTCNANFAVEACQRSSILYQLFRQELQRYILIELEIFRAIDLPMPPRPIRATMRYLSASNVPGRMRPLSARSDAELRLEDDEGWGTDERGAPIQRNLDLA